MTDTYQRLLRENTNISIDLATSEMHDAIRLTLHSDGITDDDLIEKALVIPLN